jgi:hypothetical protein
MKLWAEGHKTKRAEEMFFFCPGLYKLLNFFKIFLKKFVFANTIVAIGITIKSKIAHI